MKDLLKQHAEKFRFALVGGFNTALDFGILFLLVNFFGIDKIIANYPSTTVAFIFSFFANKTFTFRANGNARREFIAFVIVTLIGIWVLQPLVMKGVIILIEPLHASDHTILIIAKLVATIVSLVWNYILYSRIVFHKKEQR